MAYQDTIKKLKRLKGHLGLADKTDKTDKTGSVSFVSAQQGGSADVQESIVSSVNTSQLHVKKALPLPKGIKKEAPEVPDKTDKTLRSSTHQLPEGVTLADLEAELGTDPDWPKIKVSSYLFEGYARTLAVTKQVRAGIVPADWTEQHYCENCGPVPLEPGGPYRLRGCPWCHYPKV